MTIDSGLIKSAVISEVEFEARRKLSMLPKFCRDFSAQAVSQVDCARGKVVIPFSSGSPEARTNPTSFGVSTGRKVTPVNIAPDYINVEDSILLGDKNTTGMKIEEFAKELARTFVEACLSRLVALITTSNFEKAFDYTNGAYDTADSERALMRQIYRSLNKGSSKYVLGNSTLFSHFIAQKQTDYDAVKNPAIRGFDGVYECNDFGDDVAGIITDGRGIAMVNRLLDWGPEGNAALSPLAQVDSVTGINYQVCSWYDLSSRATWYSIDAAFGCAVLDKAATKIIGVAAGGE